MTWSSMAGLVTQDEFQASREGWDMRDSRLGRSQFWPMLQEPITYFTSEIIIIGLILEYWMKHQNEETKPRIHTWKMQNLTQGFSVHKFQGRQPCTGNGLAQER